jgi:hypothetical protein
MAVAAERVRQRWRYRATTVDTFDEDAATARGVATSYGGNLAPAKHYHFSSPAAASLYSKLTDLEDGALRIAALVQMRAPAARVLGGDVWGSGRSSMRKAGSPITCSFTMARIIPRSVMRSGSIQSRAAAS